MKRKIIIVGLTALLFTGCQYVDKVNDKANEITGNQEVTDPVTDENQTPDEETQLPTDSQTSGEDKDSSQDAQLNDRLIGGWIRMENGDYFDDLYQISFFQDGQFMTNDPSILKIDSDTNTSWYIGSWQSDSDQLKLTLETQYDMDFDESLMMSDLSKVSVEGSVTFALEDLTGDHELSFNNKTYAYSSLIRSVPSKGDSFKGQWQRTNVHSSLWGFVNVIEESTNYIAFAGDVGNGAHMGTISGLAVKTGKGQSTFIYYNSSQMLDHQIVDVSFDLDKDSLIIESDGFGADLGFGANVTINGEYTQGMPIYTNDNALLDTFGSQERIDIMADFLGDDHWTYLKEVIENGINYEDETMTYSGFISGAGQGADFIMTDDNKIYVLTYGEGPTHIYYTNDPNFFDHMPSELTMRVRNFEDVALVLMDGNNKTIITDYVWLRPFISEPESALDETTIQWGSSEENGYLEIALRGNVNNIGLSQMYENEDGKLMEETRLQNSGQMLNGRIVLHLSAAYYPDAASLLGLVVEDAKGNTQIIPLINPLEVAGVTSEYDRIIPINQE